jgi:hypothetical protein
MSARYRVGAALAGAVVLTAAGLVAASWATADSRGDRQTAEAGPVDQVTANSPLVADTLESQLGSKAVGSYYDETNHNPGQGVYYFFGRTTAQPYQYYYRTYQRLGDQDVWGNWIRIDLAIEATEVSALVHLGRLFVFWTHVERREIPDEAGQPVREYLFVELDTDNGWFQLWKGGETDPQQVFLM